MNYNKLYSKLIEHAKNKNSVYDSSMHHRHHILPRCLGGGDDERNLVIMTFREHFIAHLILCKLYPTNYKIRFAMDAMFSLQKYSTIRSILYQEHIKKIIPILRETHRNKVRVKDQYGKLTTVTRDEYKSQDDLKFHTTGKVSCYDINGKFQYVTTEEFHKDVNIFSRINGPNTSLHPIYTYIDLISGESIKLTKLEASNKCKEYRLFCYENNLPILKRRFKQLLKTTTPATIDHLYDSRHKRKKGEVVAWDTIAGKFKVVKSSEFYSDPTLVGSTDNMATVYDNISKKFVKIDKNKAKELKLKGPNVGKINVICTITGVRKQILKIEKTSVDLPLGIPKLFLITGKNSIHYIEWKLKLKGKDITLSDNEIENFEIILSKHINY